MCNEIMTFPDHDNDLDSMLQHEVQVAELPHDAQRVQEEVCHHIGARLAYIGDQYNERVLEIINPPQQPNIVPNILVNNKLTAAAVFLGVTVVAIALSS